MTGNDLIKAFQKYNLADKEIANIDFCCCVGMPPACEIIIPNGELARDEENDTVTYEDIVLLVDEEGSEIRVQVWTA